MAETAVLNNNYLALRLRDVPGLTVPYEGSGPRLDQIRYSWAELTEATGVTSEDISRRTADYGLQPFYTSHNPMLVPEPMTLEPTELMSRADLDEAALIIAAIAEEARTDPALVRGAPYLGTHPGARRGGQRRSGPLGDDAAGAQAEESGGTRRFQPASRADRRRSRRHVGRRRRLGLIVNPIAGMGGRVGLKGTDGAEILERALELGATPVAPARAETVLRLIAERAPGQGLEILVGPGAMGEDEARAAWVPARVAIRPNPDGGSTADDTRRAAIAMRAAGVDLLVFVGGDGTARDVCAAIGTSVPALGVPAGVKMHSAVFATGTRAAADAAVDYLADPDPASCTDGEVMDIDEAAVRAGRVSATPYGILRVPAAGRLLQGLKSPSRADEAAELAGLGRAVARLLPRPGLLILGPGTTTRAVGDALGISTTLLGIDVLSVDASGHAELVASDAGEADLLRLVGSKPATIVVSPVGGQGFILGRGNQQLSATVIRDVGLQNLRVVATPAKLAALGGRPLLLDTGDAELDRELSGYTRVVTGQGREVVCRVEPA